MRAFALVGVMIAALAIPGFGSDADESTRAAIRKVMEDQVVAWHGNARRGGAAFVVEVPANKPPVKPGVTAHAQTEAEWRPTPICR